MKKTKFFNLFIKSRVQQIGTDTTVRLCVCTECVNNRAGLGEYTCNCKEIEIQEGRCRQYVKQEKPIPVKITYA